MKSFLQGKRSLDVVALRPPHASGSGASTTPGSVTDAAAACGSSPNVEVIKQGDKIVRLIVTCTCGERTEIECLYPPGL